MTNDTPKRVYDIHGQPLRIGDLVAVPVDTGISVTLKRGKVIDYDLGMVLVQVSETQGYLRLPEEVALLETPIWPNT